MSHGRRRPTRIAAIVIGILAMAVPAVALELPAAAQGQGQYMVNDSGTPGLVRNVLPAGQTGVVSLADFLNNQTQSDPNNYLPAHIFDQRALYDGPTLTPAGQLTPQQFLSFSKEETFGVADSQVASVETPRPGLTIIRDKAYGVPHIFAATRDLAAYGQGWVSAEDRLFMMDVLRHAGRGNLASLLGSSGFGMDCSTHYGSGYDQADADAQRAALQQSEPEVVQLGQDFADGVNGWIASPGFIQHMPVEYPAFPLPVGPNQWTPIDTGAVASLIGAILGGGGGSEVANTLAFERLVNTYGPAQGRKIFDDIHAADDPESPTTIDQAFPYESRAGRDPSSVAMIDGAPQDPNGCTETLTPTGPVEGFAASPGQAAAVGSALHVLDMVRALGYRKHGSNATLVNASESVDGHPIADFGSQAAYWMPEIYMEMDIHAPDWQARGFQFPGTGVVVEIGRGEDFAWSATSAGNDNNDLRAERLCNPSSANPLQNVDPNSTSYWYKGRCLPIVEKSLSYVVPPSPGTIPPGFVGFENFHIERTVHDDGTAIVQGRTTATLRDGSHVPVAISRQRTNFFHELDQAAGFVGWNKPGQVHDAQSFIDSASQVDTTFNWFYVDANDTAYYSSGKLPIRNPAADPDLVNWATGEWDWQGILPPSMHPHAINPSRGWMTSWNNRPAPHWASSDSNWDYGSLYRNQLLDHELQRRLSSGGGKVSPTDLFNVMQVASVTDFRAQRLLDELFSVIGSLSPADQTAYGTALAAMASWHSAGQDLRQSPADGAPYAHADGISYFDSFYPHLIHALYDPWLGATPDQNCNDNSSVLGGIPKTLDNPPNDAHCYPSHFSGANVGSAFDGGWYDMIDKDLRQVLGASVHGPHQNTYCGGHAPAIPSGTATQGSLATCRSEILAALTKGIQDRRTDYVALTQDDRLDYRSLGLQGLPSEQWSNKPTQQQFIEFLSRRSVPSTGGGAPGSLPNTSTLAPGILAIILCGALGLWALPRSGPRDIASWRRRRRRRF